ncbi:hypothetical protein ABPG74_011718 [Tetrahymena malaccensis]
MSSKGTQAYKIIDHLTQSFLYGIGSFLCISISSIFSFFIYKQKKKMLELEDTDPLLPQELFDLISSNYRKNLIQLQQQQDQNRVKVPGKFLVRGEVDSNHMIPCLDPKKMGLVYQRMMIDKIYMMNQYNQNKLEKRNELSDNKTIKFFEVVNPNQQIKEAKNWLLRKNQNKQLTEFESGSIKCLITNFGTKKTNVERALKPVAYLEKFNDTIKANLKLQPGTILLIGFTQNQIGIKIGDQIMVYGSVILDLKNRIINFDFPEVIAKRKYEIQEIVSHHFSIKSIASFFLFSLGVFYAYKAATSFIKHRKDMQKYYSKRILASDLKESSF